MGHAHAVGIAAREWGGAIPLAPPLVMPASVVEGGGGKLTHKLNEFPSSDGLSLPAPPLALASEGSSVPRRDVLHSDELRRDVFPASVKG